MSYAAFSFVFLGVAAVPLVVAAIAGRLDRAWGVATLVTTAALVVLTIVFDSLMVSVDLFRYDQDRASGIDVLRAPIEDLTWPVAAGLLVPSLWRLAGGRDPGRRDPTDG